MWPGRMLLEMWFTHRAAFHQSSCDSRTSLPLTLPHFGTWPGDLSIMKCVLLVLAVLALLCAQETAAILDSDEIASLMALRTALPRFYPPNSFKPILGWGDFWDDWSRPLDWPETSEGWKLICSNATRDGPNVFGLTCKDGHIHAMSWYAPFPFV